VFLIHNSWSKCARRRRVGPEKGFKKRKEYGSIDINLSGVGY